mmetsp:Transcript_13560/g.33468  ORF Transcript_13560/g.33468 Transcript_13560/m.33468 type:complete len:133 (-) Transcript_13560:52-450(-)
MSSSPLVESFLKMSLAATVFISVLNSLFTLGDQNAVIALFGFYGVYQRHKSAYLMYVFFVVFSTVMDVVRILVWYNNISRVQLGTQNSLGFYYIILTSFGVVMKIVGGLFGFVLWRSTPEQVSHQFVEDYAV